MRDPTRPPCLHSTIHITHSYIDDISFSPSTTSLDPEDIAARAPGEEVPEGAVVLPADSGPAAPTHTRRLKGPDRLLLSPQCRGACLSPRRWSAVAMGGRVERRCGCCSGGLFSFRNMFLKAYLLITPS